MGKTYKLQYIGGSIYICIPSSFFSSKMLENKCARLELLEKREGFAIIKLGEVDEEHDISVEADREDASESGPTADVREAG